MSLDWSYPLDAWQALKLELQLETDRIFASSGEVVIVQPDGESRSILTLESRARFLRLTYIPERNSIRWDTDDEYGFERISDSTASLARELMRRLRR